MKDKIKKIGIGSLIILSGLSISAKSLNFINEKNEKNNLTHQVQNRNLLQTSYRRYIDKNKKHKLINPIEIWKKSMIKTSIESHIFKQSKELKNIKIVKKPIITWINHSKNNLEKKAPIKITYEKSQINFELTVQNLKAKNFKVTIDNQDELKNTNIKTINNKIIVKNYQRNFNGIRIRIIPQDNIFLTNKKTQKIHRIIKIQNQLFFPNLNEEKDKKYYMTYKSKNNVFKMLTFDQVQSIKTTHPLLTKGVKLFLGKNNSIAVNEELKFIKCKEITQEKVNGKKIYKLKVNFQAKDKNKKYFDCLFEKQSQQQKINIDDNLNFYNAKWKEPFPIEENTFLNSKKNLTIKIEQTLWSIEKIIKEIYPWKNFNYLYFSSTSKLVNSIEKNSDQINLDSLKSIFESVSTRHNLLKKENIISKKNLISKLKKVKKLKKLKNDLQKLLTMYEENEQEYLKVKMQENASFDFGTKMKNRKKVKKVKNIITNMKINEIDEKNEDLFKIDEKLKKIQEKIIAKQKYQESLLIDRTLYNQKKLLKEKWKVIQKEIEKRMTKSQRLIYNFLFKNKGIIETLKKLGINTNNKLVHNLEQKVEEYKNRLQKTFIDPLEGSDKFILDEKLLNIKFVGIDKKQELINKITEQVKKTESNYDKNKVIPIYKKILNDALVNLNDSPEFKKLIESFWYSLKMQKSDPNNKNPLLKKIYKNIKFVNMGGHRGYSLVYNSEISENISMELDQKISPHLTGYIKPQNINGNGNSQNSFAAFILRAKNGYKFKVKKSDGKGHEYKTSVRILKFVTDSTPENIKYETAKDFYFNNFQKIYQKYIKSIDFFKKPELINNMKIDEKNVKFQSKIITIKSENNKNLYANLVTIEKKVLVDQEKNTFANTSYSFYLKREYLEEKNPTSKYFWGYDNLPKTINQNGVIKISAKQIFHRNKFLTGEYFKKNNYKESNIWKTAINNETIFNYEKNTIALINYFSKLSEEYNHLYQNLSKSAEDIWEDIVDENQDVWDDIKDAFEDLGKELNKTVMPVLQYILDPGMGIQKIISLNTNYSMAELDQKFKIIKDLDEDIISGILPNNILSFGVNIAILPISFGLEGALGKVSRVIFEEIEESVQVKYKNKINNLIKNTEIPMKQINDLGIYENEAFISEIENETSFIKEQKLEKIENSKKYVDRLFEENKNDLSQLGADGGEEMIAENQIEQKKKPKLGLKGGQDTSAIENNFHQWNNEKKAEFLKDKLMNEERMDEEFGLNWNDYTWFIETICKSFLNNLENPSSFMKNERNLIYEIIDSDGIDTSNFIRLKQATEFRIKFYENINKIIFDKFSMIDVSIKKLSEISRVALNELNIRITWPNAEPIQRQIRAWTYAVISSKNEWAISNIPEKMMTHIYRMMNFLKPENIRPQIINSYKNWIMNEEEKFKEYLQVMESLKGILEENISSVEAQKIQDTINILKRIETESILRLMISL